MFKMKGNLRVLPAVRLLGSNPKPRRVRPMGARLAYRVCCSGLRGGFIAVIAPRSSQKADAFCACMTHPD